MFTVTNITVKAINAIATNNVANKRDGAVFEGVVGV